MPLFGRRSEGGKFMKPLTFVGKRQENVGANNYTTPVAPPMNSDEQEETDQVGELHSPPPSYEKMQSIGGPGIYPRLDTDSLARLQRGQLPVPTLEVSNSADLPSYSMTPSAPPPNMPHSRSDPIHLSTTTEWTEHGMVPMNARGDGHQLMHQHSASGSPMMSGGLMPNSFGQSQHAISSPNLQSPVVMPQIRVQNGATTGITIPIIMHSPMMQSMHMHSQNTPVSMPTSIGVHPHTGPAPIQSSSNRKSFMDKPPPRYSIATGSSNPGVSSRHSIATGSSSPGDSGKRLSYCDFVPKMQTKRTFRPDKYETFSCLVERANIWLEGHGDVTLVSCETVTWTGLHVDEIFSDNSIGSRSFDGSMNSKKNRTVCLRGLRVWYITREIPYSRNSHAGLYSETFLPRDEGTRLNDLIEEVNAKRFPGGKVLSVECVSTPINESSYQGPPSIDPELSYWTESPSDEKRIVIGIRIFIDMNGENKSEKIALKSFVPNKDSNVSASNNSYETFPEMFRRAARWITQQVDIRPCTVQTTPCKIKKKGDFEEKTMYTEHASSTQKFSNKDTHYLSVIRVFYLKQQIPFRTDIPAAPAPRLSLRTFLPSMVSKSPIRYEEMRKVMDRLNQWHKETRAKVLSIETVRIRGVTPGTNTSEASAQTYSVNSVKSCPETPDIATNHIENWLYMIRVCLAGDYSEAPHNLALMNPDS